VIQRGLFGARAALVQGIVPFAQHTTSSAPPAKSLTLFAGVRLFL